MTDRAPPDSLSRVVPRRPGEWLVLAGLLAVVLGLGYTGYLYRTSATLKQRAAAAVHERPEIEIDHDARRVIRRDSTGQVRWSTRLEGYLGLVRPPHLLWDADRVYVTNYGGVTALDGHTGKVLWHSKGPEDRLLLSGELLLAADCQGDDTIAAARGRWLTARAVKDGKEVFRVRLPTKEFDPESVREVAGLFLVQETEDPGGEGRGLLIDRKGQVCFRLDRQLVTARRQGKDLVLLTSRDVARVSPDGRTRWSAPFRDREWVAGGGLVELPGGDLVAFLYGHISDSGVQVVRLDPVTGKAAWQARCAPLGVVHSAYSHAATATVQGDRLTVTSRGSSGTFVEVLDLKSGRQLGRTRP